MSQQDSRPQPIPQSKTSLASTSLSDPAKAQMPAPIKCVELLACQLFRHATGLNHQQDQ